MRSAQYKFSTKPFFTPFRKYNTGVSSLLFFSATYYYMDKKSKFNAAIRVEQPHSFNIPERHASNMLRLKNGSEYEQDLVIATLMNLDQLMDNDFIALVVLVRKCRNDQHDI